MTTSPSRLRRPIESQRVRRRDRASPNAERRTNSQRGPRAESRISRSNHDAPRLAELMSDSEGGRSRNDGAPTGRADDNDIGIPQTGPPDDPDEAVQRENPNEQNLKKTPKKEIARRLAPWKSRDPSADEDEAGGISTGDICRICHMGGFPVPSETRPMWEWQNRGVRRVESQISTLSSYAYLGPLVSACKCRGTVGMVHAECLERWLTESGHTRCELCGHKYATKRVPRHGTVRSVGIWFQTVIATRQMLLDILYLVVTTPLALFSCYVCVLALKMILKGGLQDIPWMVVAMLPTCSLTLIAYWGWLITLGRLHSRRWRRFWRNNFVVRLLPDAALTSSNSDALGSVQSTSDLRYGSSPIFHDAIEHEEFLRVL